MRSLNRAARLEFECSRRTACRRLLDTARIACLGPIAGHNKMWLALP